jgi:CheR methyltransferase, all-alpha domain
MNQAELTEEEYRKFCELIYRVAGIRIAENKRVMVTNRVRRRLRATEIKSFAEYYGFLISPAGNAEMPLFLDAITTNETYFFRDTPNSASRRTRENGPRACGSGRPRAAPERNLIRSPSSSWERSPCSPAGRPRCSGPI